MDAADVRSYVARTSGLLESGPPSTRAETRTWLVDPLLETLGWNPRGEACAVDATVAGTAVEYVLSIDGTPGAFVAVDAYDDDLAGERESAIRTAMAATGVDRAIYTNGREFVLLAGVTGDDRTVRDRRALASSVPALTHFARDRLRTRLARHSRALAARRLATDREALEEAIVDALLDRTGDAYRPEFERASEHFVDCVLESLVSDGDRTPELRRPSAAERSVGRQVSADDESHPDSTRRADARSDTTRAASQETPSEEPSSETDERAGTGDDEDDTSAPDGRPTADGETTGEYVVRFFNDRGSIGAIGHSNPAEAMAAAAEFCFENGLSGIRLPWAPDGDVAVVNDDPTLEDGTPMDQYARLENGTYLNTAGPIDRRATRLEALAERAGLRAMLTGDW